MLNKAILIGNLGKDPELKKVGDSVVANIRIATSSSWKDKASGKRREETEWHDVEVWGSQAEACGKCLRKGRMVCVEGRLKTDHWEDEEGRKHSRTKVISETVKFLDKKPADQPAADVEREEPEPQ